MFPSISSSSKLFAIFVSLNVFKAHSFTSVNDHSMKLKAWKCCLIYKLKLIDRICKNWAFWKRQEILSNENNTLITWYILSWARCNQRVILKIGGNSMECVFSLQLRWKTHLRLWQNRDWLIRTHAICVKYFLSFFNFQWDFILKCFLGWTWKWRQLIPLPGSSIHLRNKTYFWQLESKTSNKAADWCLFLPYNFLLIDWLSDTWTQSSSIYLSSWYLSFGVTVDRKLFVLRKCSGKCGKFAFVHARMIHLNMFIVVVMIVKAKRSQEWPHSEIVHARFNCQPMAV